MNDEYDDTTDENTRSAAESEGRPLGFWLRTVDAWITREFARAFDDEGVSRGEWMLLNALAGDVDVPGFAERLARKGKRMRGLEDRGWAEETGDGTWVLTEEGRAAKERLGAIVDGIRSRVASAVSPEDFATTLASLEAIARELGWNEDERDLWPGFGRGFRRGGQGFGPRAGRGFGPDAGRGFGPDAGRGFGPGFGGRPFGPDMRRGFGQGPFGRGFGSALAPEDLERLVPHFAEHFAEHMAHHLPDDWRDEVHGHGHGRSHGDHGRRRRNGGHDRRADGHGHGSHDHHTAGRGRDGRNDAESAYERGFEAGFARGQATS